MKHKALFIVLFALTLLYLASGCKKSDLVAADKSILFVPSAFTPNGDHHNDTFGILASVPLTYFYIKIYDNANILIFESADLKNCWDGTANKQPEPTGSYLWIIEYQANGIPKTKTTGYVQIVR